MVWFGIELQIYLSICNKVCSVFIVKLVRDLEASKWCSWALCLLFVTGVSEVQLLVIFTTVLNGDLCFTREDVTFMWIALNLQCWIQWTYGLHLLYFCISWKVNSAAFNYMIHHQRVIKKCTFNARFYLNISLNPMNCCV